MTIWILGEALFGTIWRRDALSPVQREMITLSTLIVLAHETQLRRHLGNALHVGLTPEQIVELILHDTWYGDAPAGLNALVLCKDVFAERGVAFTPPHSRQPRAKPTGRWRVAAPPQVVVGLPQCRLVAHPDCAASTLLVLPCCSPSQSPLAAARAARHPAPVLSVPCGIG